MPRTGSKPAVTPAATSCVRRRCLDAGARWRGGPAQLPGGRLGRRVRGEHPSGFVYEENETGSSPRPRGALDQGVVEHEISRIIPASAGSTCTANAALGVLSDHPRRRGEHTS